MNLLQALTHFGFGLLKNSQSIKNLTEMLCLTTSMRPQRQKVVFLNVIKKSSACSLECTSDDT